MEKKFSFLFFCIIMMQFQCFYGQTGRATLQCLNRAVPDGRVDSVWAGYGMPQGFTGEDVIIGFTDWGFDYTHPVFYDTTFTHYRILRAWDQYRNAGPAPAGFDYGTELVGQAALLQAMCDTSNVYQYGYHGTHVAGIAAGAGAGTVYRGVAPGANLLFASFLISEQAVIDAFRWMYNVAQSEQKRLVINMSWGLYYMGQLDGMGNFAEAMQELSDEGVVFVTSAGNNGGENFHVEHAFSTPNDTLKTQIKFTSGSTYMWGESITMCNSADAPFQFALHVMNSQNEALITSPFYDTAPSDRYIDTFLVVGNDTLSYNLNIVSSSAGSQRPTVRLRLKKPANSTYKFGLFVTAPSGDFHAWNLIELTNGVGNWGGSFAAPLPGWSAGNDQYGLGTPAVVDCAISVAAHQARFQNNAGYWIGGNIADFSSIGPTIDGRMKPEISAPGVSVVSALSSYTDQYSGSYSKTITFNGRSYKFVSLSGTSMSSPFISGVVALMLEANPYLSPAQIKEILIQTAYGDSFTVEAGVNAFGAGKVDAYAAVMRALECTGIEQHSVSENRYRIYPNPASDNLYLIIEGNENDIVAQLFDMSGKLVLQQNVFSGVNHLQLSFPAGCYFLRLSDRNTVTTKKLIIN